MSLQRGQSIDRNRERGAANEMQLKVEAPASTLHRRIVSLCGTFLYCTITLTFCFADPCFAFVGTRF